MCALATQNYERFAEGLSLEMTPDMTNMTNITTANYTLVFSINTTVTQGSVSVIQCVCEVGHGMDYDETHARLAPSKNIKTMIIVPIAEL